MKSVKLKRPVGVYPSQTQATEEEDWNLFSEPGPYPLEIARKGHALAPHLDRKSPFNPRLRLAATAAAQNLSADAQEFQSTPPRGGRRRSRRDRERRVRVSIHAPAWGATRMCRWGAVSGCGFNPRPRVGGDEGCDRSRHRRRVSIHAPAWGATPAAYGVQRAVGSVSIHAPAWGATRATSSSAATWCCFNPRPRVGGD